MQCGVRGHNAAKMVVQHGQDVVRSPCKSSRGQGPRVFEFMAGVCPEGEVGVCVLAVLFRGEEALGFVEMAGGEVGGDLGAECVGFGVGFEAV